MQRMALHEKESEWGMEEKENTFICWIVIEIWNFLAKILFRKIPIRLSKKYHEIMRLSGILSGGDEGFTSLSNQVHKFWEFEWVLHLDIHAIMLTIFL